MKFITTLLFFFTSALLSQAFMFDEKEDAQLQPQLETFLNQSLHQVYHFEWAMHKVIIAITPPGQNTYTPHSVYKSSHDVVEDFAKEKISKIEAMTLLKNKFNVYYIKDLRRSRCKSIDWTLSSASSAHARMPSSTQVELKSFPDELKDLILKFSMGLIRKKDFLKQAHYLHLTKGAKNVRIFEDANSPKRVVLIETQSHKGIDYNALRRFPLVQEKMRLFMDGHLTEFEAVDAINLLRFPYHVKSLKKSDCESARWFIGSMPEQRRIASVVSAPLSVSNNKLSVGVSQGVLAISGRNNSSFDAGLRKVSASYDYKRDNNDIIKTQFAMTQFSNISYSVVPDYNGETSFLPDFSISYGRNRWGVSHAISYDNLNYFFISSNDFEVNISTQRIHRVSYRPYYHLYKGIGIMGSLGYAVASEISGIDYSLGLSYSFSKGMMKGLTSFLVGYQSQFDVAGNSESSRVQVLGLSYKF